MPNPHLFHTAYGSYLDPATGQRYCQLCQLWADPDSYCTGAVDPPCHCCYSAPVPFTQPQENV